MLKINKIIISVYEKSHRKYGLASENALEIKDTKKIAKNNSTRGLYDFKAKNGY
jgi:hypothetical protein